MKFLFILVCPILLVFFFLSVKLVIILLFLWGIYRPSIFVKIKRYFHLS